MIENPANYYTGLDVADRIISRNVLLFERRTRGALQQKIKGALQRKNLAGRMHHRYVLIRSLQTAGVISVDGKALHLKEGAALLMTPYQFHHYIDLAADELHWLFITFELEKGETQLGKLSHQVINPDTKTDLMWSEIANLWVDEHLDNRVELLPILDRLLTRIHSSSKFEPPLTEESLSTKSEWIVRIESLIFQSVREHWSLEEVARRAGLSERHLRNRFEAQMGISLRDHRSNYQLHLAISLMRNQEFSISDIAELSGFNSQSVFTHFIRRMSGQTPRELRARILSGEST
ncbi:AraC family transcriptional regulator [Rubellicoccus peritrichatus]|uniref:AraC family transcriptional regulator n=1 Tax=Rubellicoccus peritrichatus TaxID=3080537 RepID=A0AAQ3QRQ8_9BACT|nr:AraC family transcriptional regulator [Puniceicoccus sp. CR14]WOO39541.1 AraC family transcriptional regulator [Puniceicoccus sp. CR14]